MCVQYPSTKKITKRIGSLFINKLDKTHILQPWCYRSAKLWSNVDFAPQSNGAMQTLPRKITATSLFAMQNYGAMQTLLRKIVET